MGEPLKTIDMVKLGTDTLTGNEVFVRALHDYLGTELIQMSTSGKKTLDISGLFDILNKFSPLLGKLGPLLTKWGPFIVLVLTSGLSPGNLALLIPMLLDILGITPAQMQAALATIQQAQEEQA